MVLVRMKLKEGIRRPDGNYLIDIKTGELAGRKLVNSVTVEFYCSDIKMAIDCIDLNEIEELHIEKDKRYEHSRQGF